MQCLQALASRHIAAAAGVRAPGPSWAGARQPCEQQLILLQLSHPLARYCIYATLSGVCAHCSCTATPRTSRLPAPPADALQLLCPVLQRGDTVQQCAAALTCTPRCRSSGPSSRAGGACGFKLLSAPAGAFTKQRLPSQSNWLVPPARINSVLEHCHVGNFTLILT